MKYRPNNTRFENYKDWNQELNNPYDYERNGLLSKIMSRVITESKNPVLCLIKEYFEKSIIFLLKYVDEIKNFKNIYWKNR